MLSKSRADKGKALFESAAAKAAPTLAVVSSDSDPTYPGEYADERVMLVAVPFRSLPLAVKALLCPFEDVKIASQAYFSSLLTALNAEHLKPEYMGLIPIHQTKFLHIVRPSSKPTDRGVDSRGILVGGNITVDDLVSYLQTVVQEAEIEPTMLSERDSILFIYYTVFFKIMANEFNAGNAHKISRYLPNDQSALYEMLSKGDSLARACHAEVGTSWQNSFGASSIVCDLVLKLQEVTGYQSTQFLNVGQYLKFRGMATYMATITYLAHHAPEAMYSSYFAADVNCLQAVAENTAKYGSKMPYTRFLNRVIGAQMNASQYPALASFAIGALASQNATLGGLKNAAMTNSLMRTGVEWTTKGRIASVLAKNLNVDSPIGLRILGGDMDKFIGEHHGVEEGSLMVVSEDATKTVREVFYSSTTTTEVSGTRTTID